MPTITVDVDVYLDEFDEDEIVDELEHRGYYVSKEEPSEGFDREDWDLLLDLVDRAEQTVYTNRVRDKLMKARYGN